ncbi:MAG: CRP/FNR family transcriptional regulator [Kangiellaceae bacterium]|jgi:CRP/FNR family transcriptional regulator
MNISSLHSSRTSPAGLDLEVCLENAEKSNHLKLSHSHRIFQARQSLFCAGDRFEGLYILRSGSAKSFITSINGEEHITKFYYPGDLLGVDGFDKNIYVENVLFLETSSVCLIKESDLNTLVKSSDDFRNCLLRSMSRALVNDSSMMMCLSSCSSEQKLAQFVLDLSEQFRSLRLSGTEFRLSMTRTDIANYMGMALETVSRVFASFQLKQLICIKNRQLSILDFDALSRIVLKDQSLTEVSRKLHTEKYISAFY